jgi:hypothetical protein
MLVCWKKDVEKFPTLPLPSCGANQKKKKKKKGEEKNDFICL